MLAHPFLHLFALIAAWVGINLTKRVTVLDDLRMSVELAIEGQCHVCATLESILGLVFVLVRVVGGRRSGNSSKSLLDELVRSEEIRTSFCMSLKVNWVLCHMV